MLADFPLCFVALGRIGTHVRKYTPFRSPSASRLSKNLHRIKIYLTKFLHYEVFKVHCGSLRPLFELCRTFNILAHPANLVKAFSKLFSKFFASHSLWKRLAAHFWQLIYITTSGGNCQVVFLILSYKISRSLPCRTSCLTFEKAAALTTACLYYHPGSHLVKYLSWSFSLRLRFNLPGFSCRWAAAIFSVCT